MKLPNQSGLARIPMSVLIAGWVLAVVVAAGCLVWALLSPSGGSNQAAATKAAPTKAATSKAAATSAQPKTPATATALAQGVTPAKPAATAPAGQTKAAPSPTAKPGASPTPAAAQPTAPQPTALPINETFGYGIQINGLNDYEASTRSIDMTSQLKMTWVKQQLKWGTWSAVPTNQDYLDRLIRKANKANVKVMLSIVTAPSSTHPGVKADPKEDPDNIKAPPDDPNAFADFAAGQVARAKELGYPIHAIEVWNEQNLDREWRTNPQKIDPARYMQLLSATYKKVKAVDPNVIVISGALSPTGCDDGTTCMDDLKYLERMVSLGLTNNADCIGVHHNGINVPPDVAYQDAPKIAKAATATFRGPFDNPHHSWSFKTTLQESSRIAGGKKPLCITEFGWPTSQGLSTPARAGFEFSKDNTLQDQANYIVQAFQLMKQWGFVKVAFLWNLNFNTVTSDPTTTDNAIYSILDPNGMPRPAFDALGAMKKQ